MVAVPVAALAVAFSVTVAASATVGGTVNGFVNEANGGSYINGCAGGLVSGGIQSVMGYSNPVFGILGGAGNGLGSYITDILDNVDSTNEKNKTSEEIKNDAINSAVKGMIYSIPGSLMGWCVDKSVGVASELMVGYSGGFREALKQFYGILDNLLLAADSSVTEEMTEKE